MRPSRRQQLSLSTHSPVGLECSCKGFWPSLDWGLGRVRQRALPPSDEALPDYTPQRAHEWTLPFSTIQPFWELPATLQNVWGDSQMGGCWPIPSHTLSLHV